jgi:hypothetical protein
VDSSTGTIYVAGNDNNQIPQVLEIDEASMMVTKTTPIGTTPALWASIATLAGNAAVATRNPSLAELVDPTVINLPSSFLPYSVAAKFDEKTKCWNVMVLGRDPKFDVPYLYVWSACTKMGVLQSPYQSVDPSDTTMISGVFGDPIGMAGQAVYVELGSDPDMTGPAVPPQLAKLELHVL